jgi:archaellum component FlaC
MDNATWNLVLTALLAVVSWVLKDKAAELKRLEILLNKTREEVAREYVTKVDVHNDINRVLDRIDRLENKLDAFLKDQRSALN